MSRFLFEPGASVPRHGIFRCDVIQPEFPFDALVPSRGINQSASPHEDSARFRSSNRSPVCRGRPRVADASFSDSTVRALSYKSSRKPFRRSTRAHSWQPSRGGVSMTNPSYERGPPYSAISAPPKRSRHPRRAPQASI